MKVGDLVRYSGTGAVYLVSDVSKNKTTGITLVSLAGLRVQFAIELSGLEVISESR